MPPCQNVTVKMQWVKMSPRRNVTASKCHRVKMSPRWIVTGARISNCTTIYIHVNVSSCKLENNLDKWTSAKANLPFFQLVELLFSEAQLVDLQIRLVSEKKLNRRVRKNCASINARLFDTWDAYTRQEITVRKLLRRCSHIYVDSLAAMWTQHIYTMPTIYYSVVKDCVECAILNSL